MILTFDAKDFASSMVSPPLERELLSSIKMTGISLIVQMTDVTIFMLFFLIRKQLRDSR